ncbi:helix-turn-helix domain-containing protein [Streptomyces cadmiisoli]|uniref:helix-turn-helix domain-containing protein n=1 Tax=Streptomyces cadmiisoli TaxID=2184053 RepID=UPI003657C7FE
MSGDVERDAERLNDESRYPEHLRTPPEKVLSANQLVAFNMWRARRASAWSQQEVAELLEMYTGRSWSNASVSAAERSWQGGRPRKFDANEILALSKIFDEPIAFFLLPPEDARWNRSNVGMREFPDEHPNMNPEDKNSDLMGLIPVADYIGSLGLYKITPGMEFRIQELALRHLGLSWTPPKWKMPFKHTPVRPGGTIEWNSSGEPDDEPTSLTEEQLSKVIEKHAERIARDVAVELDRMGYLRKTPVSPSPGEEVGAIIRRARVNADTSLGEIAKRTGISVYHLAAVEDGNFAQLEWDPDKKDPQARLRRATDIVGKFAEAVGLDPETIVEQYLAESNGRLTQ